MGTTRTIKNKHAANGSGVKNSKLSKYGPKNDGVIKAKKGSENRKPIPGAGVKGRPNIADIIKKRKKRVYSEKELGIPQLNMVTPVGVQKPKGKKKGKVFVDDRVRLLRCDVCAMFLLTVLRRRACQPFSPLFRPKRRGRSSPR